MVLLLEEYGVAGLLSLLLCLFGSHENEIYQSLMTELDDNVVNRRPLRFLLLHLCARRVEIHQVRKWGEKQDNEMVSSYPIFLPHAELISLHCVYHRFWEEGRIQRLENGFTKLIAP